MSYILDNQLDQGLYRLAGAALLHLLFPTLRLHHTLFIGSVESKPVSFLETSPHIGEMSSSSDSATSCGYRRKGSGVLAFSRILATSSGNPTGARLNMDANLLDII